MLIKGCIMGDSNVSEGGTIPECFTISDERAHVLITDSSYCDLYSV